MSDDQQDSGGQGQPDASLDDRVSRLETGQESITGKLDQLLGIMSGGGNGGHRGEPTAPGNPAEEIRRQLDERDRARAADDAARTRDDRLGAVEAKVSELAEKPPEPLVRRVEKLMWGKR